MKLSMVAAVMFGSVSLAAAEPIIGTAIDYGAALDDSDLGGDLGRLGLSLYGARPLDGAWTIGGELAGTVEGHTGGYGCGTVNAKKGEVMPAVAVTCLQPTAAAHLLLGRSSRLGSSALLRLEGGVGVASAWLVPSMGGHTEMSLHASAVGRAALLFRVGRELGGEWWTGVQLQERALGLPDIRAAASVGWVLEAAVLD